MGRLDRRWRTCHLRYFPALRTWRCPRSRRRRSRHCWRKSKNITHSFNLDLSSRYLHATRVLLLLARLRKPASLHEAPTQRQRHRRPPLELVCHRTDGQNHRVGHEITEERENEYIAWRSLPGSDIQVDGHVEFRKAPADRGTLIIANLQFAPLLGQSSSLSKFFSKGANFALRQDLRRLEALMEAGEIPTTEGQSHGPRDFVTGVMRLADPTRPIPSKFGLRKVFEERRRSA